MADLSRKTASIYINHAPAEEALKKLQTQADKLSEKIKKGQAAGKGMVDEIKKLNTAKEQIAGVQRQIDQGLKPSFNQLQALVAKTRAELKKMSESDAGFKQKTKELNKYSTELSRLGTQIGAVKKESGGMLDNLMPSLGIAAAAAGIAAFLKGAVTEALEADKAMGKFKGTLDNLGKGESFDRLSDKADAMAERFKFLDNDDVIGVFDKLITYGKLTEAQIDELTPVIVNFAAKSRISLDESASVIIKALEGSGKQLKEYGINISDAKTESERLSVVMNELGQKVNGAAEAFGSTTSGQIAETEQTIKNLKEEIGQGLLPIIKTLLTEVGGMVKGLQQMASEGIGGVLTRVKDGFVALVTGGRKALDKLNLERNAIDPLKRMDNISEGIATGMGQKSIIEQKKYADAYKNVFINARKELAAFRDSADKDDKAKEEKLIAQVQQKGKIFLSTQRTLNDAIAQEKKVASSKSATTDDKAIKGEESKRLAAMKKAQEDALRLQKIWEDFKDRIFDPSALQQDDPVTLAFKKVRDQAAKDAATAKDLLNKKVIDFEIYSQTIVRIEEIRLKSFRDLAKKYDIKTGDANFVPGQGQSMAKPITATTISNDFKKDLQRVEGDQARTFRNDMAAEELKAIVSTGKKKLNAELNVLEFQKAAELANKDLTENEKLLIEEKYRGKRKESESKFQSETAEAILSVAEQVASVMNMFSAASSASDEAKLAANQRAYDEDLTKLDRQLRQKLVSQKEYDRQIRSLDDKKRKEDAAIKTRQFERDKRAQIIQAIMAGAGAVINAMKAAPPLNFIFAGLATAMVAAQIATISAQKAPQFAKGGLLEGPSHKAGGIAVVKHGKKIAEVEGGEAILSKKTVQNNWNLVSELLKSSMHNNGAKLIPYSQTRMKYKPINYAGITQSMDHVRHFEKGGILPGGSIGNGSDPIMQGVAESLNNLNKTVSYLNESILDSNELSLALRQKLSEPFKSYTLLSDVNAAQNMMDRIIKDTTISR